MTNKDNLAGLVSRLARTLSETGDRLARETRTIAKLSRLRINLKDMTYEFEETMKKMGGLYYQSGGQAPSDAYLQLIQKADEIKVQMEMLQAEIDQVMAAQRGEIQIGQDYDDAFFLGEESPFVDDSEDGGWEDNPFVNGSEEEDWEESPFVDDSQEEDRKAVQGGKPEKGLGEPTMDPQPEDSSPCPSCGQLMSHGLAYCTNCQAKL